jgi:FKBP-type peptidyl-prolyl cis-trans isomerase
MIRSRIPILAILVGLTVVGCRSKAPSQPDSGVVGGPSSAPASSSERAKILATLTAPPLAPPSDAVEIVPGARVRRLVQGDGASPSPDDEIGVDVTIWTPDGGRFASSYQREQSDTWLMSTLPKPLQEEAARVKVGGEDELWLSAPNLASWKPLAWPDGDLILRVRLLSATKATPPKMLQHGAPDPLLGYRFPAPDAAGPPKDAKTSGTGVRYVVLKPGSGTKRPSKDDRVHSTATAWPVQGLVLGKPVLMESPSVVTLPRAPTALRDVLAGMVEGETRRIWLPAEKARGAVPMDRPTEIVLDLTLTKLE